MPRHDSRTNAQLTWASSGSLQPPARSSRPVHQSQILCPFDESNGPITHWVSSARSDSSAVSTVPVYVQFHRYFRTEQGVVKLDRLAGMEGVVNTRAGQKRRRSVFRYVAHVHFQPARVNQDRKIRTATLAIDRVGGVRVARVNRTVTQAACSPPRREPHDSHALSDRRPTLWRVLEPREIDRCVSARASFVESYGRSL